VTSTEGVVTAPEGGDLTRQIGRGALWSALDVGLLRLGNFALGLVVARIVSPADFGVFAVALVVHSIVVNVAELGVTSSLIRDTDEEVQRSGSTVVTIAIISSGLLALTMLLLSGQLATILGNAHASNVIAVMSLTVFLAGPSAVPFSLLRRNFRMDKLFFTGLANFVVSSVVIIALGLRGWGPMALAWSRVAGQTVETLLLMWLSPTRFRPGWRRDEVRRLLSFGLPLAGANILSYALLNVDYIVVGIILGDVQLGFYYLAFNISGWPSNVFGTVVRSVSLPAFSRVREDVAALPGRFGRALNGVSSIAFPICLLLGALAVPLVTALYGGRWEPAAAALVGLAILAACRSVTELFADFLVAMGRTRAVFIIQVIWLAALIPMLIAGAHLAGIGGVGIAHAAVATLVVVPSYLVVLRTTGIRTRLVLRSLAGPLAWSILAAGAAWLIAEAIPNPFFACIAGGTIAAIIAVIPHYSLLRRLLTERLAKRREKLKPDLGTADGPLERTVA
jgi:O-antigen/teichoic acid export membrane protein